MPPEPLEPSTDQVAKRGRPRRYEQAEELQLLLDAAFEVIRRNGYQAATVGDIIGEAGVSTRSFYRHFESKDELLQAMYRRDAELFATAVTRRVEKAPTPWDAVVVWIDEILGFGLGRPRARRAAVLESLSANAWLSQEALRLLEHPLTVVLRDGTADGAFECDDPATEAALISAMAWETSNRLRDTGAKRERDALRTVLLSFAGRALAVS